MGHYGKLQLEPYLHEKTSYNGRDKNRVQGGIVFDPTSGKYIETGGLAEGESVEDGDINTWEFMIQTSCCQCS